MIELNIKYFPRGEYKKGVPTVPLALEPLTIKGYDGTFLKMLPVPSVPILLHPLTPKECSWNTFLIRLLYPLPISRNYVNTSSYIQKTITHSKHDVYDDYFNAVIYSYPHYKSHIRRLRAQKAVDRVFLTYSYLYP